MMWRRVGSVLAAAVLVGAAAAPAAAATVACRPGADSPRCQVWTGKVSWVADGDTPLIDIYGDGTSKPVSVRLIGVQAMEQSVYNPVVSKRRGECHALAATARAEYLIKKGGGIVRLTAMNASSHSDVRNRPLRSVAVKINGSWYDIGLDLIRNGYALWLPTGGEWAWNPAYQWAAQQAAAAGRNLYDTDACGSGPYQNAKVSVTVNYDAPGNDEANVNGEWIRINNGSSLPLPVGGWWVRDSGLRRYTFPQGTTVPARGAIYVHVGKGTATATQKYWGLSAPIFDNPTFDAQAHGDGGYLFDPKGDLRAWMLYPCVTGCTTAVAG
jgi:endonuclease YncB( thermonuclease family)